MTILYWIVGAYTLLCAFLCYSGPFVEVYWAPMAWVLRKIRMQAITLGRFCFKLTRDAVLSEQGKRHEKRHWWQWMVLFVLFPPVYLTLLKVQGYQKHWLENDARRAAGEPER